MCITFDFSSSSLWVTKTLMNGLNLEDDAVKVLHSICQQIWKTQQWPQDWKRSFFIPIPKKGNAREYLNYHTVALISHASKVMLKILQARRVFSNTWTVKFQMFKLVLEKAEDPEIKLTTFAGSSKKQESSRKISISTLFLCQSVQAPLTGDQPWLDPGISSGWRRWRLKR